MSSTAFDVVRSNMLTSLTSSVKLVQKNTLNKVLKRPVRVVLPKLLSEFGIPLRVRTTLFWGAQMDIILPEVVSTHIYRYGYFDFDVCRYFIDYLREGHTYIDVGSHLGFFSLLANRLVGDSGRVIAIEPTPSTANVLQDNLHRYATHPNYQVHRVALSNREGYLNFNDYGILHSAYNSLIGSRDGKVSNAAMLETQTLSLDRLVSNLGLTQVDFIKIDAESSELDILAGAENTLIKYRPAIALEIGDTGLAGAPTSSQIIHHLTDRGYIPFELKASKIIQHIKRADYTKASLQCYNLLFLPHR
jgi:FkbM family methyltransferase